MKTSARLFIALIALSGLVVLGNAVVHATSSGFARSVSFLLVACLAARLKVKLPGLTGTMSVNLPFILVAVAQMSVIEALAVACLSTLAQCLPASGKKFNAVQTLFNVSNMALAAGITRLVCDSSTLATIAGSRALLVAIAAAAYLLVNTVPVAIIISLTENKSALRTWAGIFQLSFPYFVAGAGIAGVVMTVSAQIGWGLPLAVLPLMFGIFHSYRRYFSGATAVAEIESRRRIASVRGAS